MIGVADNDGDNDIVVVFEDSGLDVLLWNGQSWPRQNIEAPGFHFGAALGDADNDGKNEIVLAGIGSGLTLIRRTGNAWTQSTLEAGGPRHRRCGCRWRRGHPAAGREAR